MIYDEQTLIQKLGEMMKNHENEVVEFKEAKKDKSFNEIGQYFSALSNEANLRGKTEGWLIFGITNAPAIIGTNYRSEGRSLQSLKKEIMERTNQRNTFQEIYELDIEGKRVILFQIPPAIPGIPTTWNDMAYGRSNESLVPLSMQKMDLIRHQIGFDWSKVVVEEASMADLDPEAIRRARELFIQHEVQRGKERAYFEQLTDEQLLNKAGILLGGKVTRTALLLLGDEYAKNYFDGFIPRITWTLYNQDGSVKSYEHFDTPFLLAVDKVFRQIRNVKYRYIAGQQTLFPEEVDQYDAELIKELLHNCIAHQDYTLRGKINVEEFEDYLVFINEGGFIPETIETALEPGYKPPYYRNTFLCNAMVNLYMIDSNAIGIPTMFRIQQEKFFPLPSYDLSVPNRVKVTVYGKILDKNYTQLLNSDRSLNIHTVFLLDKVQKKETITHDQYLVLKKAGLVEGRYPSIYVSYSVAEAVGQKSEYIRNRGLEDEKCKEFILKAIEKSGEVKNSELLPIVEDIFPRILSEKQKRKKLSNLLQAMKKKDKTIDSRGRTSNVVWFLRK